MVQVPFYLMLRAILKVLNKLANKIFIGQLNRWLKVYTMKILATAKPVLHWELKNRLTETLQKTKTEVQNSSTKACTTSAHKNRVNYLLSVQKKLKKEKKVLSKVFLNCLIKAHF